ncbi:MAG: hypothetical protein A2107_14725 [Verrucomicrobia bacterium GWF2_62_7]|nr:MAG: hypothetical protein A2107_14725 [Verrucomicrobia bacterium GWF2_62_7]
MERTFGASGHYLGCGAIVHLNQETPSYHFPEGIPAFEDHKRFTLARDPSLDPLLFLRSEIDPNLRFVCIQVRFLVSGYTYELDEAGAALLGVSPGNYTADDENLCCMTIISVSSEGPSTANLLAPVVINFENGLGLQAVQVGGEWSHVHPIELPEAPQCS